MSELRVSWPVLELHDGRTCLDAAAFARAATLAGSPRKRPTTGEPIYIVAPEQTRPWLLLIPATIGLAVAAILAFV